MTVNRKIILLVVSCLTVVALLVSSCAPAVVEEEAEAKLIADEREPKYGGWFSFVNNKANPGWDQALISPGSLFPVEMVCQDLLIGDWAKGPGGTGETDWAFAIYPADPNLITGCVAESWEQLDPVTWVFHIRKGVHWHNKPPVNGRELTADDVVFSLERYYEVPTSLLLKNAPEGHIPTFTALDKYTVEVKCPDPVTAPELYELFTMRGNIIPPEVIDEYGDMNDWRNVVGTGPFILTDEIPGSSATLERNPDYWMYDPLHPKNKLPYPDGIHWLTILDASTIMAGFRTGKIDNYKKFTWEEGESLLKDCPWLQYKTFPLTTPYNLFPRTDREPYNDIRVRHALSMAIDRQAMIDTYHGGNAQYLAAPVMPVGDFADMVIPFEELPENVREIYEYHPDKARELLAEAGYPDGFKTEVYCLSKSADVDAMVASYWADIGVDLEIKVHEYGTHTSLAFGREYDHFMHWYTTVAPPFALINYEKGTANNFAMIDDPYVSELAHKLRENYYNYPEKVKLIREWTPYMLEKCWFIQVPNELRYIMWTPWLGGNWGTYNVGPGWHSALQFAWVDEDLKAEILGTK